MLDGAHLLNLEVPDEFSPGAIQSKHDDPIDEEPFIPENLAVGIRAPFHDPARRQFVVAEHLDEIEHSFSNIARVLHEASERSNGVEFKEYEVVTVELTVMSDRAFDA